MSELSVGSLSGLAANSYVIDVASGSSLDLANAKADSLPTSAISTGGILQVVSTTKTDTYSSSILTNAFDATVVTGLSASITPRSTNSKILVRVELYGTQSTSNYAIMNYRIERDGTAIGVGDAAGSRPQLSARSVVVVNDGNSQIAAPAAVLDSPSTTSTVTYNVRIFNHNAGAATFYVNRSVLDSNDRNGGRPVSSITLIEVAG